MELEKEVSFQLSAHRKGRAFRALKLLLECWRTLPDQGKDQDYDYTSPEVYFLTTE